nr:uncharacterized protein LOC127340165 [Lolium perenne]
MGLDLNVRLEEEEDRGLYLDLNITLQEEEEHVVLPDHIPEEQENEEEEEEEHVVHPDIFPEEEEEQVPQRHRTDVPESHKFAAYIALKALSNYKPIEKADKELVAQLLKTSLRTVEKTWKKAHDQEANNEELDFSNKRKGRCGRKRKELNLSERVPQVALNKRGTSRALARSLDIPYSTLQRRLTWGELRRHTSSLKPFQSVENKIKRLKFCISMVDETTTTTNAMPLFKKMENIIHIDEKWFDMTKRNRTYYLLPEEEDPVRTIQNKNSIGKVMFLTAVAKPRHDGQRNVTFDGKVGIWAFVTESAAKYNSKNRTKGTMELKTINVTRDVMREYLCEKVIPAIAELWPDDGHGETIWIQQDNARTHVLPDDPAFLAAVKASGLDIKSTYQPPNSPDLNVLDLCFFSSIQSLAFESAPNTLKELIESVEQAYDAYKVDTLEKVFVTLQTVLLEVMKDEGGNQYKPPHMGKDKLQKEGRLSDTLEVDDQLYQKTLELIANYEQQQTLQNHVAALAQQEEREEKKTKGKQPAKASKRKAHGTGPQVIVDDHIIIPGNTYETWLNDPSSLLRQRRRVETQKINLIRETKIGELQASIQEKLG